MSIAVAGVLSALSCTPARAGTYPMYQCSSSHPTVSPGWSVFEGTNTVVGVSFSNTCQSGGAIGVEPNGGKVTEDGDNNGGTVGLALNVPASAPDVSIASISAHVLVSPVGGDDAFANFDSDGQGLQGLEDFNGGSGIDTDESWTLPLGARDFEASVFCSTDGSNTTCYYPDWNEVPALNDITITLSDPTPPQVGSATGTLVNAAAHGSTVSGSQTIGFTAKDADSGVLSTTLTLTPQGSGATYTKTTSFSSQCAYESWNACPLSQNVSPYAVPTATLKDGTYAVTLTASDAAGNVASESLGTITTENKPKISVPPSITGNPALGQSLDTTSAITASEPEAGKVTAAGQWQRCDPAGSNCVAIAGATSHSYYVVASDEGHTLRYQETVSNNDGSTTAQSAAFGPIQKETTEAREAREAREAKEAKEANEAKGSNGSNGSNGANGGDGSNGSSSSGVTVNVGPGGSSSSSLGSTLLGSSARWIVSLRVSPAKVQRRSKIRLTGTVSTSPRPSNGKLIFLQARSVGSAMKGKGRRHRVTVFGKWVTFQEFRAKGNGTFSSSYTFKLGGHHTYQFQAVAPAEGQYRNPTGTSRTVTVREI